MKSAVVSSTDRDLSWIDFNTRVLELAENQYLPLLERVKFLAIYSSNLDEFFMVRVASIKRKVLLGKFELLESGLTPQELLNEILQRVRKLHERVTFLVEKDLRPRLSSEGIKRIGWDSLSVNEQGFLTQRFKRELLPVLTPLASDSSHPFPHISGLSLNLGIIVKNPGIKGEQFVRVKVPSNLPRMMRINESDFTYILIEDLITEHLHLLLPGATIVEIYFFRITRNQDLEIDEDESEDLLETLEEELLRRKYGAAVRMEVEGGISKKLRQRLMDEIEIESSEVFTQNPPLDLTYLFEMQNLDLPQLKDLPLRSVKPAGFGEFDWDDSDSFFAAIRGEEILLHHPYQSFSSTVGRFLELATQDPNVLAIKQTLYRTSADSPIMMALIEAAKSGKQVLAVIEIRARFDEQANVRWAKKLEDAGAHVVYGVLGLKTHAKASLVVRKEESGLTVYTHIGTGNYNNKTARAYDDLGIMSSDQDLGEDVLKLFNQLSGVLSQPEYSRLIVAPQGIRKWLIERIENERRNHRAGKPARIQWKINSLVDQEIINNLLLASNDGVPIDLIVRGACSLRMSQVAKNKNVQIRSILGRFLEHSRIYSFHNGGDPEYFIGSADIMERNLDRRVEALVRVKSPAHKKELSEILDLAVSPRFRMWAMNATDSWEYKKLSPEGDLLEDFQEYFIERYKK